MPDGEDVPQGRASFRVQGDRGSLTLTVSPAFWHDVVIGPDGLTTLDANINDALAVIRSVLYLCAADTCAKH